MKRAPLTELGKLVSIAYRDESGRRRVKRWGVRGAPVLAYDARGKLHVVFGAKVVGDAARAGVDEYARTHWGQRGAGEVSRGRVLERGRDERRLGPVLEITYATTKGTDRETVHYWHTFGDGAKGQFVPPGLFEAAPYVMLRGGSYTVTKHGIVG